MVDQNNVKSLLFLPSKMHINRDVLDTDELKVLNRVHKFYGKDDVEYLLSIDAPPFARARHRDAWNRLVLKIRNEIEALTSFIPTANLSDHAKQDHSLLEEEILIVPKSESHTNNPFFSQEETVDLPHEMQETSSKTFQFDLSKIFLNRSNILSAEEKLLEKIDKVFKRTDIEFLLSLEFEDKLRSQGGFGKLYLETFDALKTKINMELNTDSSLINDKVPDSNSLFVYSEAEPYSLGTLGQILLDDIERYLHSLDPKAQDIALSRWGFTQQAETLESVGKRLGLTRERVRQLEKGVSSRLRYVLRIHPQCILKSIKINQQSDIRSEMPNLSQCFESHESFYNMLEICSDLEQGSLLNIAQPEVKSNILMSYFSENPSPIDIKVLLEELVSEFGYVNTLAAEGVLRVLQQENRLIVKDQKIFPINLLKKEAVAHVLSDHPQGLPWQDIARLVNRSGCCSSQINENRTIQSYFSGSDYVYLSGRGVYRHIKYLNFSELNVPELMEEIVLYFKKMQVDSIHLNDFYRHASPIIKEIDYFDFRHLVRTFSSEHGLFFNGKSGVDGLGLNSDFTRISQQKLILEIMKRSNISMTKQEIAERLKSQSLNHASYYLDKMMKAGDVVRVDAMTYTTPENAFNKIDIETVLKLIEKIISSTDKIVEADVLRVQINAELNLSYTKYFYSALASLHLEKYGWYKTHNLFSRKEFLHSNLFQLFCSVCDPQLSSAENIKKVRNFVWVTDSVAAAALNNWKIKLENGGSI
jgi:hypothetical protein